MNRISTGRQAPNFINLLNKAVLMLSSLWSPRPELRRLNLKNPMHLMAVGFGSGLVRWAPGTAGTVAAIPAFLLLDHVLPAGPWYALVVVLAFIIGVPACDQAAKTTGVEDDGAIVWDEFVGFFITMLWVPADVVTVLLGFALFRVLDILKPWPIRWVDQQLKGGMGIMVDDVLAGLGAGALLWWVHYSFLT